MDWRCSILPVVLVSCSGPAAPVDRRPLPNDDAPDVVVLLVDTLRADALGVYGGRRATPTLDAFGAQAVVFERAISPSAWTVPSVASVFTASWPQTHGVLRFRKDEDVALERLPDAMTTLAEHFHEAGYDTAALLKTGVISEDHGFAQGFDTFRRVGRPTASGPSAEHLVDAANDWLDGRRAADRPFLLYLHFQDPHTPYQAPEAPPWTQVPGSTLEGSHAEVLDFQQGRAVATDADRQRLRALYDAEVAYLDRQLARLMSRVPDNTVFVVLADHGEAFQEHGRWLHGDVWPENVHVPLMIRAPGVAPRRVSGPVSTIDVAPTVARLAGLTPHASWTQGIDRSALLGSGEAGGRAVFVEHGAKRAVWQGDTLYVEQDGQQRVFDVRADPGAQRPLDDPEAVAARAAQVLEHIRDSRERGKALTGRRVEAVSDEQKALLKELGYVE